MGRQRRTRVIRTVFGSPMMSSASREESGGNQERDILLIQNAVKFVEGLNQERDHSERGGH